MEILVIGIYDDRSPHLVFIIEKYIPPPYYLCIYALFSKKCRVQVKSITWIIFTAWWLT